MEPAEPLTKRAKTEASSGITLVLVDGTTMPLAADNPLLAQSETLRLAMSGPVVLADLSGTRFPVHGFWTAPAGTNLRELAAAQHPALRDLTSWHVALRSSDEPTGTVHLGDLGALRQMRLAGKPDPDPDPDPHTVVVLWKSVGPGRADADAASAATVAEVGQDRDGAGGVVTLSRCVAGGGVSSVRGRALASTS